MIVLICEIYKSKRKTTESILKQNPVFYEHKDVVRFVFFFHAFI